MSASIPKLIAVKNEASPSLTVKKPLSHEFLIYCPLGSGSATNQKSRT